MKSSVLNRVALIICFLGIFIAGVLSLGHILRIGVPCGAGFSCERVTSHASSYWFGIRVAYIGLAFYVAMALFTAVRQQVKVPRILTIGALIAAAGGMIAHVSLAFYAYNVIQSTCYWCLGSMATMILLFFAYAMIVQSDEVESNRGTDLKVLVACSLISTVAIGLVTWRQYISATTVEYDSKALNALDPKEIFTPTTPILGEKTAPISIVEFGDLFCPACREGYPEILRIIKESNGKINFVFKHYPILGVKGHELSVLAAKYSVYAADHDRFWEFLDKVYRAPDDQVNTEELLLNSIKTIGLNPEDAQARVDGEATYRDRAYSEYLLGCKLGIRSTPTFIIFAKGLSPQPTSSMTLELVLRKKVYQDIMKR